MELKLFAVGVAEVDLKNDNLILLKHLAAYRFGASLSHINDNHILGKRHHDVSPMGNEYGDKNFPKRQTI